MVEFSFRCRAEMTNQKLSNGGHASQSEVKATLSNVTPSYTKPPIIQYFSDWTIFLGFNHVNWPRSSWTANANASCKLGLSFDNKTSANKPRQDETS